MKEEKIIFDNENETQEEFEKWKEEFAKKNGFYIPCIHDKYYYEKLRNEDMKMKEMI